MLSGSLFRKAVVTVIAAVGFVSLYEVTILDSQFAARQATLREATASPRPGARLAFIATAYCKGMTTASGVAPQSGIAAADPDLLPVGSVITLEGLPQKYNGIYTVLDTGPAVQGREVDVYMWSCNDALEFGRRQTRVTVLRLGWNPIRTSPAIAPRPEQPPLPSRPLPPLTVPKD